MFLKSLLLGLLFFTGISNAQYRLDLKAIKGVNEIANDKDLEEAANSSIDQLLILTQQNYAKLKENKSGNVNSNFTQSTIAKIDSLTRKQVKLIQVISEKCWSDKGFDPLFFRKNMDHLARVRDTSFLLYAELLTRHQQKSKYRFNRAKFDRNDVEKSISKLKAEDQNVIRLMYSLIFDPAKLEAADFNTQMATFRMLQLEYVVLENMLSEHYNLMNISSTKIENTINYHLEKENKKNLEIREQLRLETQRKLTEQKRIDSLIEIEKNRSYHIVGVGDMMLGTNFPNKSYLPPANGKLLAPVSEYLQNADCTFGNLEGTVLDEGGDVKHCSNPKICYAFRMPEKYADEVKEAGFDLISVANNHVGDFGAAGRANTTRVLKERGFCFSGLLSRPWDTVTVNGLTYGLISFSPNTGTVRINNYPEAIKLVRHVDTICDVLVVSFHGGAEGSKHQHVTKKTEIFYGENRGNVYQFTHLMIDNGADVLFGHGPHVTRAIDIYKDRFITYSMGNFCTYHRFNLSGVSGVAPIYDIEIDKEGKFIKGKIISTKQVGEGGPNIDPAKRALKLVQELTKTDIPEVKIKWEGAYFSID